MFQNSSIIKLRYALIIGIRKKKYKRPCCHYNTLLGVTTGYLIKKFSEKMNGIFKPLRPIQM
jgi:hypothetical protein